MLVLGIYIGGLVMALLSCLLAAMEQDESEELPIPSRVLVVAIVVALCLLWPVSIPCLATMKYLENR